MSKAERRRRASGFFRGLAASIVLGQALVLGAVAAPALADDTAFTLKDKRIAESSGLAADAANGVIWTANDDAPARVFAVDDTGKVQAVVKYGAPIKDVEGLARAGERLYIGDIGDNAAKRDFVTVYSILNPRASSATVSYRAWDFAYPDGKAYDAEALLVDKAGQVYIVTKGAKGAIYTYDGSPSVQGVNKLTRVASAPAYVTDGTFLPDGRMALRTYLGVFVLDTDNKVVAQAQLPYQKQGESITLSLDGKSLLVGSEGRNSTVLRVDVPTAKDAVPTASAQPPTPSKSAAPADEGDQSDAADGSGGTWWALGLAGLVALLAALVTALIGIRRRPRPEGAPVSAATGPPEDPASAATPASAPPAAAPPATTPPAKTPPAETPPAERPGAASTAEPARAADGGLVHSEGERRSTWAENAPAEPTADEIADEQERADLDWLYDDRR